jgi:hypothetical protein
MNTSKSTADQARLKRMRWSELDRAALEAGLSLGVIRRAKTRDDLRRAILEVRA